MKHGWNKISSWSHKTWAGKHICILSSNLKLDELSWSSISSLTKHLKCVISVLLTYCLWASCCSSLFCSLLLGLYSAASPWSSAKEEAGTGCSGELLSLAEDDWFPSVTSTRMALLGCRCLFDRCHDGRMILVLPKAVPSLRGMGANSM